VGAISCVEELNNADFSVHCTTFARRLFPFPLNLAPEASFLDNAIVPLLCDPITHAPLELDAPSDSLISPQSGRNFPLREGIPVFVDPVEVTGPNRKYQTMYDRLAPGYDLAERLYTWFKPTNFRAEFLQELEIHPAAAASGFRVLEVSVGTGANLRLLPGDLDFFGLDLSWGMLRKCQRNVQRWHRAAHLFQGQAERLPFREALFDCVFHVGGINFFSGKAAAIREMIRVAKPGTKIVIVDETEKVVKDSYQKNPMTKKFFEKGSESVACPIDLVPEEMLETEAHFIAGGKLYCLTFRKP
jgi:ubiquinone/menaquinone biosynthesis C-methylase UbiE